MKDQRVKNTVKYVVPTILSDVCFFLFTIVDGIFVGRSVGTNGLGAINLVAPYILIIGAISMLINIGGVTICAIRIGKGDVNGANKVFRQGLIVLCGVISVLSAFGVFGTDTICSLLGANETFRDLAADYLFWYSIFIIPAGSSVIWFTFGIYEAIILAISTLLLIRAERNSMSVPL